MKTFLLIYMLSGQGLDLTSTVMKLNQGCREANPVFVALHLTTGPRIALLKGGFMAGFTYGFERSYSRQPGIETALGLLAGSAGYVAGWHNLSIHCRGQR